MTDIRDIARLLLSKSNDADPLALSRKLMMRLTPEQREEAALAYCGQVLEQENRFSRAPLPSHGRSRWQVARDESEDRGWKFLDDCTFDDLIALADSYAARAAANLAREHELRALADELAASGFQTVGEMRSAQERAA